MVQELVFSRPWAGAVSMAALLGILAGCGGIAADPEDSTTNVTVVLSVLSGDVQTGRTGKDLPEPVIVRVQQSGAPWVNKTVNFVVTVGGGSVLAGTVLTDSEGVAQEFWTLGGPGEQALEARAVSSAGERLTFTTFRATAIVGPPTLTNLGVSADTLRGFMGWLILPSPGIVARDGFGNPMTGKEITWTASAGDLGVPGLTSRVTLTSANGVTSTQWWAAQAPGFATVTASMIDDLTGDTIHLEEPFVGITEQTVTWIAEFGDLNWSDGANWDIGRPPEPGELVRFSASGNHAVTLDVSASVASIHRLVSDASGSTFTATGIQELVIPLGSFLTLTDTLFGADLPKVVLDGGGLTGNLVFAEIHWTSGQVTMDRSGNTQSFSMFASGVGIKLLDVAPKVSATDSDVFIRGITWDDASELRIRGGPNLYFPGNGITVRGGDPLPGFGQMSVVSDDGLKPTFELAGSPTIAFQFVGSTPSTIILTGVDFVVSPGTSFTVTGDLPAIGQFYDLILLQGGSTFSSGAIPSDANYEFQVNPVPGVGLRAIRRQ